MLVVAMIVVIIFIAYNIIRVWHAFGSVTTLNDAFPYIRNVITDVYCKCFNFHYHVAYFLPHGEQQHFFSQ